MRKIIPPMRRYVGQCPYCNGTLAGMDVFDVHKKKAPEKRKVECRYCGKIFKYTRLVVKRYRKHNRIRLKGFRRTAWDLAEVNHARDGFVDLFNMFPTLSGEDSIKKFADELVNKYGWSPRQVNLLQREAAQRSNWADSRYVQELLEFTHYDKAFPMVTKGRDAGRFRR